MWKIIFRKDNPSKLFYIKVKNSKEVYFAAMNLTKYKKIKVKSKEYIEKYFDVLEEVEYDDEVFQLENLLSYNVLNGDIIANIENKEFYITKIINGIELESIKYIP
ncbi:hypothetical protein QB607_003193 [Clostridium botulinum]|nr:hypothetical protein [Clostridium botulinum]EKS4395866.1 hypothetical protein [Clostridium botulinum]